MTPRVNKRIAELAAFPRRNARLVVEVLQRDVFPARLHLRSYTPRADGTLKPNRRGVSFSRSELGELREALARAEEIFAEGERP